MVKFPIIVNSNNNVLRVDLTDTEGTFKILDQQGKLVDQVNLKPLNWKGRGGMITVYVALSS